MNTGSGPEVFRIARDVAPSVVVLENVPGLVGLGGLTRVLSDLASIGFDAEWGVLGASAVGAPHRRERFWLVGHTVQRDGQPQGDGIAGRPGPRVCGDADRPHADVADAVDGDRRTWSEGESATRGRSERALIGTDTPGTRTAMEHTDGPRCEGMRPAGTHGRRVTRPADYWPPLRDDAEGWRHWIADGGPQPVLRRDADGPPGGLADSLHLGGNGLVPQAATEAIRQLLERF